jgi:hypothetical protein
MRSSIVAALLLLAMPAIAQVPTGTTETNPIVHVEVLGTDAPRLQRFYSDLFGWPVTLNPIGYGYVPAAPAPPVVLSAGIGPDMGARPLVTFYVRVSDPAAILARAVQLGGRVVVPPTDVPGNITFARFADPEGNVIGIVRRPN